MGRVYRPYSTTAERDIMLTCGSNSLIVYRFLKSLEPKEHQFMYDTLSIELAIRSRRRVMYALEQLEKDGWIKIEDPTRGPGKILSLTEKEEKEYKNEARKY